MVLLLQWAFLQVLGSMTLIMIVLWPVFKYSEISVLYFRVNETAKTVNVMHKCSFMPPPVIELGFSITACIASYAVPLGGIIYWFVSVPFFLKKRAENSLVCRSSMDAAMRRITTTVLVLTAVYVLCWSPYWISIFAHRVIAINIVNRPMVIASYFIHLLPYISCSAYPLIFTVMNRRIKSAHNQILIENRRRRSNTNDIISRHKVLSRIESLNSWCSCLQCVKKHFLKRQHDVGSTNREVTNQRIIEAHCPERKHVSSSGITLTTPVSQSSILAVDSCARGQVVEAAIVCRESDSGISENEESDAML
ncbi:hypothetical protein AB6A40_008852 [Gnathostoma spinigerum]|uniref:G-protein coupled receptors family 1 profile domain-containing protein n=1 Tax=Gnathostoma spinigerum TaxID=75299 RepID=A0ABD6EQL0_9BILA